MRGSSHNDNQQARLSALIHTTQIWTEKTLLVLSVSHVRMTRVLWDPAYRQIQVIQNIARDILTTIQFHFKTLADLKDSGKWTVSDLQFMAHPLYVCLPLNCTHLLVIGMPVGHLNGQSRLTCLFNTPIHFNP